MFLRNLVNSGGIDVLDRVLQFTSSRQYLITDNIANISTPNFRPQDVDPRQFQHALADAIRKQSAAPPGQRTPLKPADTDQIQFTPDEVILKPSPMGANLLFHDGNDRSVEALMKDLAENILMDRTASELLRSRYSLLRSAIRGVP